MKTWLAERRNFWLNFFIYDNSVPAIKYEQFICQNRWHPHAISVWWKIERILLFRAGGGDRPYETRQPAATAVMVPNLKQGSQALDDKSERCLWWFLLSSWRMSEGIFLWNALNPRVKGHKRLEVQSGISGTDLTWETSTVSISRAISQDIRRNIFWKTVDYLLQNQ